VNPTTLPSAGLLVLRLVVGATFLVHGLDKLVDLTEAERFFAADGGVELVLLLGVASLAIALAGPGRFSVDAVSGLGRQLSVEAALRLTRRISRRAVINHPSPQ